MYACFLIGLWFSRTIKCCYYNITNVQTAVQCIFMHSCAREEAEKMKLENYSKENTEIARHNTSI